MYRVLHRRRDLRPAALNYIDRLNINDNTGTTITEPCSGLPTMLRLRPPFAYMLYSTG